jgi:uncharacterized protein with FMN-binding domain
MYHRHTFQVRSSACSTVGLAGGSIRELFQRTASAATVKASAKAHGYRGTAINTTREPIQAVITVNGKKITKVKVVDPTHTARSQVLDDRAIPVLVRETPAAPSARINEVSGATSICQAYISSLQAAVKSAHLS